MKLRRILAVLLSIILILNFTSCGKGEDSDSTKKSKETTTEVSKTTEGTTKNDTTEDLSTEPSPDAKPDDKPQTPDDTTDVTDGITPLLYKVTDAKGNVVWLFGSIHVGKDYFYPLPDYVMDAYNSSDALAVELDAIAAEDDLSGMMTALMPMVYIDGTKIKDHIPEDVYNDAKAILKENGMYYAALDYYHPILWSTFIETVMTDNMGYDSGLGIDYFFLNQAHDENKTIYEVESVEFQMDMLAGFSEDLQIMMLESAIDSYNNMDDYENSLDELADAWARGDGDALVDDGDYEFESKEEERLYEEYNKAMLVDRNISMADFAENALKSGEEVFIVVGAAHVVGKGGMADLLAKRGYTVEVVK